MSLFFPIPDPNYAQRFSLAPIPGQGILHEFHEMLHGMSEKGVFFLASCIEEDLWQASMSAQCCTDAPGGHVVGFGSKFDGGVRMLTNPIFYKIEMVGKAKRRVTARGKQVKASKAIIEARLDEEHRHIRFQPRPG